LTQTQELESLKLGFLNADDLEVLIFEGSVAELAVLELSGASAYDRITLR
jgi:hypothetical protein